MIGRCLSTRRPDSGALPFSLRTVHKAFERRRGELLPLQDQEMLGPTAPTPALSDFFLKSDHCLFLSF